MPLTLDCFCAGDPAILACTLAKVEFIGSVGFAAGMGGFLTLSSASGVFSFFSQNSAGSFQVTLNGADFITASQTGGFDIHFRGFGRGTQLGAAANYYIKYTYQCIDISTGVTSTKTLNAFVQGFGANSCISIGPPPEVWLEVVGPSSASIFADLGSTFGCEDIDAHAIGDVFPPPDPPQIASGNGKICVCPSGGTPPYVFLMTSGSLPCGQSFNSQTGCIDGTPDGTCAAQGPYTFRVYDSTGSFADVTCQIIPECPACQDEFNYVY